MPEMQFSNRVRFNWGYHDAVHAVRNKSPNFGFTSHMGIITGPTDVLNRHPDKAYAQGWQQGYFDAHDGMYEGSSEDAWQRFLAAKALTEAGK